MAAWLGLFKVLEHLLSAGVDDINVRGYCGQTALFWAIDCEDADESLKVVRLLLDRHAVTGIVDDYGSTVLHVAAARGHVVVMQELLE